MEFARTSPKNLKLVLTARRIDALKQLAEEIKEEVGNGVQVLPLELDVSKPVRGFVDSLPPDFKDIGMCSQIPHLIAVKQKYLSHKTCLECSLIQQTCGTAYSIPKDLRCLLQIRR